MSLLPLFIIISVHIFLLSKLVFFPYPELFIYTYLTDKGLTPYKDIFDQHFPGLMFFPLNLASMGIDTPAEMRILQFVTVAASQLLLFLIAKSLFKSNLKAILASILYIPWQLYLEGYVLWIENFSTPILLAAFYGLIKMESGNKKISAFWPGLLMGIALLFKQVTLPLVVITFAFIWYKYRKVYTLANFTLGLAIPGLYLLYFVINRGILNEFFFWTVTFNLTDFAQTGRTYPGIKDIVKISPVYLLSFLVPLFLYYKKQNIGKMLLTYLFFTGSLFFAFARFDFVHLQPALPFAVLLIVYIFTKYFSLKKLTSWILIFMIIIPVPVRYLPSLMGNNVIFYGDTEKDVARRIMKYSGEGESIFAFGTLPHIYQLTGTLPPGRVFVFQFPWFMDEAEDEVLQGIILDPPKVIIMDRSAEVANVKLTEYMSEINTHIGKYFRTVEEVGTIEIMIPN